MIRLIKDKKARAAIPMPRQDPLSNLLKTQEVLGRALEKDAEAREKESMAKAVGIAAGKKAVGGIWHALTSTEIEKDFAAVLRTIFKPVIYAGKWISSRVVLTWQLFVAIWMIILLIVVVIYIPRFGGPWARVYAAEHDFDMSSPRAWMGHIGTAIVTSPLGALTRFLDRMAESWDWQVRGQFVSPEYGQDRTKYGVYLEQSNVYTPKEKFGKEPIYVWATPQAEIMPLMEKEEAPVQVSCELEDLGQASEIMPSESIPLMRIPGTTVTCKFLEMTYIGNDPIKVATVTLTYPFKVFATLPVSVMSKGLYDSEFPAFLKEHGGKVPDAKTAFAKKYGITADQRAETLITPIEIGAAISELQPIIKDLPATLQVTLINNGEGSARINNIKFEMGDPGLKLGDIGVHFRLEGTTYSVNESSLQDLNQEKKVHTYMFGLDTSNIDLNDNVKNTRINIEVDYTYNVSGTTEVGVATCEDYPNEPECSVSGEGGESGGGRGSPGLASPPPEGYDSSSGPYVDFEGTDELSQDFKDIYTGKITRNQGGAPIPFNAEPGETLKSITEEIANQYNLDPMLLAAIEAEETGMHYVNRGGELCKPENTQKSYLTGCGAYKSCVCGDSPDCNNNPECKCDSASLYSDRTQIKCTAETLRAAYDHSTTDGYGEYGRNCITYKDNPTNVWGCIFCKYAGQSTTDLGECICDDQILGYYKTWKKTYELGELS